MTYEYYITMQWSNTDDSGNTDTFDINTENINMLVMHNDYSKSIMPVIYAKLSLDKSYIDKIIKNAKTASIYMNISKMQKATDANDTTAYAKILTPYNGQMEYFIPKDINYNADIDYSDDVNPDRNDIFETFSIGLMFKECIETNKQTNNTTIVNTTQFNAVMSYIQSTPALIEQFTYNEKIDQLIVPPQDSLYKTIDFFNNIAVFYDTPYRFYIEPGCVYILSSSGNPVAKIGDLYDTVTLNIRSISDENSNTEGMIEDSTNKVYYADINVKDTEYKLDNNTTKLFNSISTIIDPSKNNTITMLSEVNTVMNRINNIMNDANSLLKNGLNSVTSIPSNLYGYTGQLAENIAIADTHINTIQSDTDKAITIIQNMPIAPTSNGDYYLNTTTKSDAIKKLHDLRNANVDNKNLFDELLSLYNSSTSLLTGALGNLTNISGCFGGISSINITDNLSSTFKTLTNIKEDIANHEKIINTKLIPRVDAANNIITNTNTIITILNSVSASYPSEGISAEAKDPLSEIEEDLVNEAKSLSETVETINNILVKYKSENLAIKTLEGTIEPVIKQFDTFKTDVKSSITGVITDITNIGISAKKSLDNIINSAKEISTSIQSLDFSINSLQDLQKDINIVKDISKIGRLGISSFISDLSFSSSTTYNGTGTMIVRVGNDNVNMIKNIKADIENHAAVLTLNKNSVDTTILTPNKRFLIKNYDAHSDKNGIFLLSKKVDMFIRHANTYAINTQLELNKLYDTGTAKASQKVLKASDWQSIIDSAESILRTQNNGITLNNINDVISNAQTIQNIYTNNK